MTKLWSQKGVWILIVLYCTCLIIPSDTYSGNKSYSNAVNFSDIDQQEIELFREYLRIPSVQPDVDYGPVVDYLQHQANSMDLPLRQFHPTNITKPMVVITWLGSRPDLPSIVFNSHMDVVGVYADDWTYPPFAAEIDENGNIFARGAQDMKAAGAQYLAAIRALKRDGFDRMVRTIHLTFAPDEEIGGADGWEAFIDTDEFKSLNMGFLLDEGGTADADELEVTYAERNAMKIFISCGGPSGHAATIPDSTAADKANFMIERLYRMRRFEVMRLKRNESLSLSDVSSINLTEMNGGISDNVIPDFIRLVFDIRLAIDVDRYQFIRTIKRYAREAGQNVTVTYEMDKYEQKPTVVGPSNPFWVALADAIEQSDLTPIPKVLWASIDSRVVRQKTDIPTFGFSPMARTEARQHANNEYLNIDTYLKGIDVFKRIMINLGNLQSN